MATLEEVRAERLKKLEQLKQAGINPYPIDIKRDFTLAEVGDKFSSLAKKKSLVLAGRIVGWRGQGAISFIDLDDGAGRLQALFKRDELKAQPFTLFQDTVDIGDFVELTGRLFLTKAKEKTLLVKRWRLAAKSLRPLPDKWHGLQDVEERFRRRYLDTLMSPAVKERFLLRSRLVAEIRRFLDGEGFLEVETPMLQPQAGGAAALPFVTHYNALNSDFYLRLSPELYLKRMLVGGLPKVYELSRNFRNEGIDVTHNPEFTMLEFYESYANAKAMRAFVEKLIKFLVKKLLKKTSFPYNGETINGGAKFKVVTYYDLFRRYALIADPRAISREDLALKANQLGLNTKPTESREKILDAIYKKVCRPKIIQPTFVVDYPKDYLPLAKRREDKPELVDAWQLVIGGLEIVKAFSELNDPIDQRERFLAQEKERQAGDPEAQTVDEDFIEAMEYGLPPAGGVGIGIDRLVMLFTDTKNIREVIYFPTLRPKTKGEL